MKISQISFRAKLIIGILGVSLIPLLISINIGLSESVSNLKKLELERLATERSGKNAAITNYLNTVGDLISTLSHDKSTKDATVELKKSFFSESKTLSNDEDLKLEKYYKETFSDEFKKQTERKPNIDEVLSKVGKRERTFQYAFTANNANPLGEKHKLMDTKDVGEYNNIHKIYHPILKGYLERFELYDIFIIDNETGHIIYTCFKELDFSTNLRTGPYAHTNLAKAFELSQKITNKGEYAFVDFENYFASYDAPASFIAAPIWDGDKQIATLAFQVPLSKINSIMQEKFYDSKSGETFLLGKDGKLRSDLAHTKDFSISASFLKNKLIYSDLVKNEIKKEQNLIHKNFLNKEVLSSYDRIKYDKFDWILFSEIDTDEAFYEVNQLKKVFFLILGITILLVSYIGFVISKKLSNQIETVVEDMSKSVHEVQNANQKLDFVSNNLINTVHSQSASITESAQALEEITQTIKQNLDTTSFVTKISEEAKTCAYDGKNKIDLLILEVNQISNSYDAIQSNVESNNKNFEKILAIINEIEDKTKVINDIVFQTKLLSFNASVEAARAGEQGKGFSVVAEEVGNLAQMSGKAAIEINELIKKSADEVNSMANLMQAEIKSILGKGREKVKEGENVASICKDQLDVILENSNKLDSAVNQISSAIQEQSVGIEEVNKAMNLLEQVTHDTSNMSSKTKEASKQLVTQATSLRFSTQELRKLLGSKKSYDVDKPVA